MDDGPQFNSTSSPLLRWPQFGMRSLFLFMTACCVLFALAGMLGQLWAWAVAWMILMTAAHVAGNVWGNRLRDAQRDMALSDADLERPRRGEATNIVLCPPVMRLREHAALGWTRVVVSTLLALAGGVLGASVLWIVGWGRMDYGSLIIAGISAAVIGGFLGFLASSFLEVALRAWGEALRGSLPAGYQVAAGVAPSDAHPSLDRQ